MNFVMCHSGELSGPVFVSFEWVESSCPTVGEVEDRHVEHKHWIVHPPTPAENSSPSVHQISQLPVDFYS